MCTRWKLGAANEKFFVAYLKTTAAATNPPQHIRDLRKLHAHNRSPPHSLTRIMKWVGGMPYAFIRCHQIKRDSEKSERASERKSSNKTINNSNNNWQLWKIVEFICAQLIILPIQVIFVLIVFNPSFMFIVCPRAFLINHFYWAQHTFFIRLVFFFLHYYLHFVVRAWKCIKLNYSLLFFLYSSSSASCLIFMIFHGWYVFRCAILKCPSFEYRDTFSPTHCIWRFIYI